MHTHDWKPAYNSKVPLVKVPYTLMKCECGETYPLPHFSEGF